jgi:serine/threonine protein kinase
MGVVDLARDQGGNEVALKRLTLHGSAAEVLRARHRLLREAEVLRRLHHPNVVRLLDVVEEGDDVILVMPYLAGGNLSDRVAQHGTAPAEEIDRLAQRLLGGLAEAHHLGIIHRDVKPGNVLYDDQAEPYLADFGLAHSWDQTHGLTVAGMVVGTPGFMPPEQARDEPLTPASDIFALGATLLYAATGNGPFGTGDPGLLMVRAASGKVEKLPKSLPKPLRRRLAAMLDPRPERRPTAAALLAGYAPSQRRATPGGRVALWVLAAVVAVVVGALFGMLRKDDAGGEGRPPASSVDDAADTSVGDDQPPVSGEPSIPQLESRLDATLGPKDQAQAYALPVDPDRCPTRVAVALTVSSPTAQQLQVEIRAGADVLMSAVASRDRAGGITVEPGASCTTGATLSVVVRPVEPLAKPVAYTLQRVDSYG